MGRAGVTGPTHPAIIALQTPGGARPVRGVVKRRGKILGDVQWDEGGRTVPITLQRLQAGVSGKGDWSDDEKADRAAAATRFRDRIIAAEDELHAVLIRWLDRRVGAAASKVKSEKARRHTRHWTPPGTREFKADPTLGDEARWRQELEDDVDPIITRLTASFGASAGAAIADAAGIDLTGLSAFDVAHARVAAAIRSRVVRIVDTSDEVSGMIRDAVATSEQAGLSIDGIQRAVRAIIDGPGRDWATRIARTEVTGGANQAATEAAAQTGIVSEKQWLATDDARTRDSHADADGQVVALTEPFQVGDEELMFPGDPNGSAEEVVNCLVGDSVVEWRGDLRAVFRRWYDGEVIDLRTADDVTLTVTPNHPVLTDRGWIVAQLLELGDKLRHAVPIEWRAQPDVQHVPARIEEVYRSAREVGASGWIRGALVDFHGDRPDGDVEVVWPDGDLAGHVEPRPEDVLDDDVLMGLRCRGRDLTSAGSAVVALGMDDRRALPDGSAPSSVRGGSVSAPISGAQAPHAQPGRLTGIAGAQVERGQPAHDCRSADAEVRCEGEHAHTVAMQASELVQVDRHPFHGYVFNLETTTGWYTGNGLAVSNCRCTQLFLLADGGEEVDPGDGGDA
jgi:hypothetical protein